MSIKIGTGGTGAFASSFIPLFKAHPMVDSIVLCDLDEIKLREQSERFHIKSTCPSLDLLCQSDVGAIVLFTQNTLHGPQALQGLRAGKQSHQLLAD